MINYGYGMDDYDTVKESMIGFASTCKDLIKKKKMLIRQTTMQPRQSERFKRKLVSLKESI